jgi:hypothetical protein
VAAQRLGSESVLSKGLEPGETVVTEGALRLIPGSRITVRDRTQGKGGAETPGAPEGARKRQKQ